MDASLTLLVCIISFLLFRMIVIRKIFSKVKNILIDCHLKRGIFNWGSVQFLDSVQVLGFFKNIYCLALSLNLL